MAMSMPSDPLVDYKVCFGEEVPRVARHLLTKTNKIRIDRPRVWDQTSIYPVKLDF